MKKFFYSMVAMLMIAATATMFVSCSSDDDNDDSVIIFSLVMERNAYLGSETEAEMAYMLQIDEAYSKALGLTNNELMVKGGDYKMKCDELKTKFNGASLPAAPEISGTYTIIFSLYGEVISSDDQKREKLSTKTFTNE